MSGWPKVRVAPAPGRRVRMPGGKVVPAAGMTVARDLFVERRLAGGDLVEVAEREVEIAASRAVHAPRNDGVTGEKA